MGVFSMDFHENYFDVFVLATSHHGHPFVNSICVSQPVQTVTVLILSPIAHYPYSLSCILKNKPVLYLSHTNGLVSLCLKFKNRFAFRIKIGVSMLLSDICKAIRIRDSKQFSDSRVIN